MNKYSRYIKYSYDHNSSNKDKRAFQKRNKQRFQERLPVKCANQSLSTSGDEATQKQTTNFQNKQKSYQQKYSYIQKSQFQLQKKLTTKFYVSKDQIQNQESQFKDQINLTCFEQRQKKVELCKNFLDTGYCQYKSRCKFAHGIEQLLQNQDLMITFKTKKCKTFYDHKQCRFGERCNFKHDDRQLNQIYCFEKKNKNQKRLKFLTNYTELILEIKQQSRINKILA